MAFDREARRQAHQNEMERRRQAYQDEMERRRQRARDDRDARAHVATLPLGDREEALQGYFQDQANLSGERPPASAPTPTPTPTPPRPRPSAGAAVPIMDLTDLMAASHMAQGQKMIQDTNDAIQDEMDRRVAISREQRRMALELEKKRMDQETGRMKVEALLKRLESESGMKTIVH